MSEEDLTIANAVREILEESQTMKGGKKEEDIKILLMFSGGLDSTSLLWVLLKHTKCQIHAHHVTLIQDHNRHLAEKEAVGKIVEYCKENARDFNISYSTFDESDKIFKGDCSKINVDNQIWNFTSCRVAAYVKPDLITFGYINDHNRRVEGEVRIFLHNLYTSFFFKKSLRSYVPEFVFPSDYKGFDDMQGLSHSSKKQIMIYNSLSDDLKKMFSSCRSPIKNKNDKLESCKDCQACYKIINIKKDIYLMNGKEKHKDVNEEYLTQDHNCVYLLLDKMMANKSDEEIEKFYLKYRNEIQNEIEHSKLNEEYNLIDIINQLLARDIENFSWGSKDNHWKRIEILLELGANIEYIIENHNRTETYFKKFLENVKHKIDEEKIKKLSTEISWSKGSDIKKVRHLIEVGLVDISYIIKNHNKKDEYFEIFKEEVKDLHNFDKLSYEDLIEKRKNSHEKVYIMAAKDLGIDVEEENYYLKFTYGNISRKLTNAHWINFNSRESSELQDNKNKSTEIAKRYFRTPDQVLINFEKNPYYRNIAISFLKKYGQIVLKPNSGTCASKDVLLVLNNSVYDNEKIVHKHLDYLSEKYKEIVLEEYIPAVEYRLILINNEPIILSKKTPSILVGDGIFTIKELAEKLNKEAFDKAFEYYKCSGYEPSINMTKLSEYLYAKGLTLDCVLSSGRKVYLNFAPLRLMWNVDIDASFLKQNLDKIISFNKEIGLSLSAFDFYYKNGEIIFGEINEAPGVLKDTTKFAKKILNKLFEIEKTEPLIKKDIIECCNIPVNIENKDIKKEYCKNSCSSLERNEDIKNDSINSSQDPIKEFEVEFLGPSF